MMSPPPFGQSDQDRLQRGIRRRSLVKTGADTVVENINELAFLLTGHRKFLSPQAALDLLDEPVIAAAKRWRRRAVGETASEVAR